MEQKKYVTFMNAVEALNKLMAEKRLEGVMLLKNGRILFKAYNRHRPKKKDRLIKSLLTGWVKESTENYKIFQSIPKILGMPRVLSVVDSETIEAKNALMEREIIDRV